MTEQRATRLQVIVTDQRTVELRANLFGVIAAERVGLIGLPERERLWRRSTRALRRLAHPQVYRLGGNTRLGMIEGGGHDRIVPLLPG